MIPYRLLSQTCLLLLAGLLASGCNDVVNTKPPEKPVTAPAPSEPATATAAAPSSTVDPYNDPSLVSQYVRTIFQDAKGRYWFGPAGESVAMYDGTSLKYFPHAAFFRGNDVVDRELGNSVHAISEDSTGNLWFGTDAGVVKYDGKLFKSYTQKDGLQQVNVGRKSVLTDKSGQVWVGTSQGVFLYQPAMEMMGAQTFSRFNLIPGIAIKGIMEDRDGNLWFASAENGVFRYDGKTVENIAGMERLSENVAGGLAQDSDGNIWITFTAGICSYDGKEFTTYSTANGIGGSEIWGLIIEPSGIIWITARGATTRFNPELPASDPQRFTVYTPEEGLNCCVQSMYVDRSENVWWGTGQGLYRFDGESFYQVKKDGPWE